MLFYSSAPSFFCTSAKQTKKKKQKQKKTQKLRCVVVEPGRFLSRNKNGQMVAGVMKPSRSGKVKTLPPSKPREG